MSNYSSDSSEIEALHDANGEPGRSGPRRRGRRGGRRRSNRALNTATSNGELDLSDSEAIADESAVSHQLRLLMSPKLVKAEWKTDSTEPDPQLTYRPPATIETFGAKPAAQAPVSAATFKKSESPLQAVVATVGSMAILAALYHFGYYEGANTLPERQQHATAAVRPAPRALLPDPFPVERKPTVELEESPVAASTAPVLEASMPLVPEAPPPAPQPVSEPKPIAAAPSAAPAAPSGLYLQVAALKDRAAARELQSELKTAGFATEMLNPSEDGLIRVISGPYAQRDEARSVARRMAPWGVEPFLKRF